MGRDYDHEHDYDYDMETLSAISRRGIRLTAIRHIPPPTVHHLCYLRCLRVIQTTPVLRLQNGLARYKPQTTNCKLP